MNRDFKGVWIPKEIWLHPTLSIFAKCLWAEIWFLYSDEHGGCYASDEYLADFLGSKISRLKEVLKELRDENLLINVSFDGRKRIMKACLPGEICGELLAGKPASRKSSSPENRLPDRRDPGFCPYIENKSIEKDNMSELPFGHVASSFYERIKSINPKIKPPNLKNWSRDFSLLVKDGNSLEDIEKVIEYILKSKPSSNGFCWANVILSPIALRKNFARLWAEMNSPKRHSSESSNKEDEKLAHKIWNKYKGKRNDISLSAKYIEFIQGVNSPSIVLEFGSKDFRMNCLEQLKKRKLEIEGI